MNNKNNNLNQNYFQNNGYVFKNLQVSPLYSSGHQPFNNFQNFSQENNKQYVNLKGYQNYSDRNDNFMHLQSQNVASHHVISQPPLQNPSSNQVKYPMFFQNPSTSNQSNHQPSAFKSSTPPCQ